MMSISTVCMFHSPFSGEQRTLPAAMLPDCAFLPISRFVLTVNTGTPPLCIMLGEVVASSPPKHQHSVLLHSDQKWYRSVTEKHALLARYLVAKAVEHTKILQRSLFYTHNRCKSMFAERAELCMS